MKILCANNKFQNILIYVNIKTSTSVIIVHISKEITVDITIYSKTCINSKISVTISYFKFNCISDNVNIKTNE